MILLYLSAIVVANLVTAAFPPVEIAGLLIPTGSLIIGATFILRDMVQIRYGRRVAYITIAMALILSWALSRLLGDPIAILLASAVSFLLSETADTELFTRLRQSIEKRVLWSGVIGGTIDSGVFVVLGLSPIGAGFLPWVAVPFAIAGQLVAKLAAQILGASMLKEWLRFEERTR